MAARTIVSEILRDRVAGYIGCTDAAVVGVSDERMAVGEAAGKSQSAEGHAARGLERGGHSARGGMRDFDGLVLFSSEMRMLPLVRSSAALGLFSPSYSHTIALSERRPR